MDSRLRRAAVCGEHTALRPAAAGGQALLAGACSCGVGAGGWVGVSMCIASDAVPLTAVGLGRLVLEGVQKNAPGPSWAGCCTAFGTASACPPSCTGRPYLHAVRCVQFLAGLMRPNPKHTSKLRKVLAQQFSGMGSEHFSTEGGEDLHPYVSFTLNIET